jgi:hypothetical protein
MRSQIISVKITPEELEVMFTYHIGLNFVILFPANISIKLQMASEV